MLIKLESHSRQSNLLNLTCVTQAKKYDSLILASSTEVFERERQKLQMQVAAEVVLLLGIIRSLFAISTLFDSHSLIVQGQNTVQAMYSHYPRANQQCAQEHRVQESTEQKTLFKHQQKRLPRKYIRFAESSYLQKSLLLLVKKEKRPTYPYHWYGGYSWVCFWSLQET